MLSITPSTRFRDAAGRFSKFDGSDIIGGHMVALGDQIVGKLRPATPVRTGRAQAGWSASYFPSDKRLQIGNEAPYGMYLITGTRYMAPNAALLAVVEGIRPDAAAMLRDTGQSFITVLKEG